MSLPLVLHVLPHPGGGAEVYVDLLERLDSYAHQRVYLSAHVRPGLSLANGWRQAAQAGRRADLVHVHGDTSTILTLPLLRSRRTVWTTHGLHLLRRSNGARHALVARGLRAAIGSAAATVCSSSAERDELAELIGEAPAADRLVRILAGVPAPRVERNERAAVRAELGLADGTTACIFAGSLEPRKDPLTAARAVLEARRDGADVVLLIAGDGPLYAELEAMAGDAVRLLGFRDDIQRLMTAADIFVLPSTREGLPLALLEAMSHGVVPVVADEPGSLEAIADAGVAVPAGNVEALAAALAELAQDAARRARLADASRRRHEREFSIDRFLHGIDGIYRRALGART